MAVDFKNPDYQYITQAEELAAAAQALASEKMLALDVEGDELDPYQMKLIFFQIGTPQKAYIFDAQLDFTPLKPLVESEKILKILQNAKFDYAALKLSKGIIINNIYDTMLAERLLTTGRQRENSLAALAIKYLELELDKDYGGYNWHEVGRTGRVTPKHLKYAALDVLTLFPIFNKQFPILKKEGLLGISKLEFQLIPVVAEMELKGVKVDIKKWQENIGVLKARRDEIARQIQVELKPFYKIQQVNLFGETNNVLNLNSPLQVMEAFKKLGIDLPSTGEEVLRKINHPVARLMLSYREIEKLISAFGESFLEKVNPKTGRVHPDFMQIGADTGRFACSNPNLQQIPQDSTFRSCFVPSEGYKYVVADYSQIELRIMAELSADKVFLETFEKGEDFHTRTGVNLYGVRAEQIDKRMRTAVKTINFGLMYGRGAASIGAQIGVSPEEARLLLDKYFKAYRGVKIWLDKVGKEAVRKGYSSTLGGRKRWYVLPGNDDPNYERLTANIERQGKNTPIQGSSADITKMAMVRIYDRIKKENLDAAVVSTVHDEIIVEVRSDLAENVKELVREEMIKAGKMLLKKVKVEVDAKIASFWEH